MEKLKIKHDHTLTDILKVGIFGLFLILPILMFLPNCLYYAFNEHAQVNTTTQPVYEYKNVDFNQLLEPRSLHYEENGITIDYDATGLVVSIVDNPTGYNQKFLGNMQLYNNHVYYIPQFFDFEVYFPSQTTTDRLTFTGNDGIYTLAFYVPQSATNGTYECYPMVIDLTQMFGNGNEPTIQQFTQWYDDDYYSYTLSKKETLEIETENTVTVTETTKNIEYAWKSLWQGPILTWTNNNNFIFTINLFTQIFAISQESYLTNYLTYILTITAIYLIFDIVFVLITKLTHLINNK